MNLAKKYGPIAGRLSMGQYCPPACYELAGKRFELVMDTGDDTGDAVLNFLDKTQVEWSIKGKNGLKTDKYECRKADDRTYLVTYCLKGRTPGENHTWVIDMEQRLVTFLRCPMGKKQTGSHAIESRFTFGCIREKGREPADSKRHSFTDDVEGTSVRWTYGHSAAALQAYYSSDQYRITYAKTKDDSKEAPDSNEMFDCIMKELSGSHEPAFYVKIKEGMYLVSVTSQNMKNNPDDKTGFCSSTLCFLDNWNHLYSVGRCFGTITTDGKNRKNFVMIGKYGSPEDAA